MAFDNAFFKVLTQTLTVNRLSGVSTDGYGRPAYSTSSLSRYCRVTEKQTLVRSFEGEQEVANTVVWVRSTSTFSPSDKITLPDGTTPNCSQSKNTGTRTAPSTTTRFTAMAETFTIQGMAEFRRKMAQAGPRAMPYLKQAMWMAGKETMTNSQKEVPVETSTLKNSGQTMRPEVNGSEISVTLGYGGAASAYALAQHERTDFDHPRGGKAHYLSDPVKVMGGKLGTFLAQRIGRSIERAIAKGA